VADNIAHGRYDSYEMKIGCGRRLRLQLVDKLAFLFKRGFFGFNVAVQGLADVGRQ
jgi:hypothetical protein